MRQINPYTIRPNEIKLDDFGGYKVIAVMHYAGWAAYRGPTDWDDEQVALEGDKISGEIARLLFPSFSNTSYSNLGKPYQD